MAYGILCKHCGWEETNHQKGINEESYNAAIRRLPGRRYSLIGEPPCPGFEYSKKGRKEKDEWKKRFG